MMQRQGQIGQDGAPLATQRPQSRPSVSGRPPSAKRQTPWGFIKEVRNELRKVAWPTRPEVRNYSIVVLITLVFLIGMIFALDYGVSAAAVFLFK